MIVGLVAGYDLRKGSDAGKGACIGCSAGLAIITRYFPRMRTE
jgi:hypothetical protein